MKKHYAYKLTDSNMQTRNGYQWKIGELKEVSGTGDLCTGGWLHFYSGPLLAILLNPIHADLKNPRLFRAEVSGKFKDDSGLKQGWSKAKLVKELKIPEITANAAAAFAILCSLKVYKEKSYVKWAKNWLLGKDRTYAAYAAANAATDAAAAATDAAAAAYADTAAAYADTAAAYAADTAAHAADAAAEPLNLIKIVKRALEY
jgi:hypothetical protein